MNIGAQWVGLFAIAVGSVCTAVQAQPGRDGAESDQKYMSPNGWTISYPSDWPIDSTDTGNVQVRSPAADGRCAILSGLRAKMTTDELTDAFLAQEAKFARERGMQLVVVGRRRISLQTGVTATEIVTEIRGRGDATKSRRVHGVTDDRQGWIIGCESYVRNWEKLEGAFDRIINSFSLRPYPATADRPGSERTVTREEMSVDLPGSDWTRLADKPGKSGIQILRRGGASYFTSLSIWPVTFGADMRGRSPREHTAGYFAHERDLGRGGVRWEGWAEGERAIAGRRYPIMSFRIVHSSQRGDSTPAETGVFLLYFPDDFETRQRFYSVMWLDTYPLGEQPRSLNDLDAFVSSIRLKPQTATVTKADASQAAAQPPQQTYRWVDKEGYANYAQTPPPETQTQAPPTMTPSGLVDRAARFVTGDFEKRLGGRLTGIELLPFESKIPGTMKWKAVAPPRGGERIGLPTKILVEFPPGWALMVTVLGTADNDAVARSILSNLRTTSAPECFWPVYRNMMNAAGRGSQAVETERKFRESAAAGDPRALTLNVDFGEGLTLYFDNNGQVRPCHTFQLAGRWVPGGEPGLLVTSDRRSVVGVEFLSPERLRGLGY